MVIVVIVSLLQNELETRMCKGTGKPEYRLFASIQPGHRIDQCFYFHCGIRHTPHCPASSICRNLSPCLLAV